MATRYRRLGLVRDPELERALAATRSLLSPGETRSAASHVRTLALHGARSLLDEAGPEGELRRRLADDHSVIPARADLLSLVPPAGDPDPDDPTPASDALRWVRGK